MVSLTWVDPYSDRHSWDRPEGFGDPEPVAEEVRPEDSADSESDEGDYYEEDGAADSDQQELDSATAKESA